jgi:hypothetical protein
VAFFLLSLTVMGIKTKYEVKFFWETIQRGFYFSGITKCSSLKQEKKTRPDRDTVLPVAGRLHYGIPSSPAAANRGG